MKDAIDIPALMAETGARARAAAAELALATADEKAMALNAAADAVWARRGEIAAANADDLAFGREAGLSTAMLDRLTLNEARIRGIVEGLRAVAAQSDPVGAVIAEWDMPSGLHVRRVRTPLGVLRCGWQSDAEQFTLCAEVPDGMSATVVMMAGTWRGDSSVRRRWRIRC